MSRHHDFATRLRFARALIAGGATPAPAHLADQFDAASVEVRAAHDRLGAVLPILEPDRNWRQRLDSDPSAEVRAYLLAALIGCLGAVCPHLRRGGPRPAFARLPLRRVDCTKCLRTLRRPPPDEADRCDVCGARGVTTFHPFAGQHGPAMVMGDACPRCASVLGIVQEAAS